MKAKANPDWYVLSLARGLSVIRAFTRDAPILTVSEVAERSGVSRAAARRFLLTLVELGYVGAAGERYLLKPLVLDLGYAYLASMNVGEMIQPYVDEVAERTGESSSVAVLTGSDIIFIARKPAKRLLNIAVNVGTRLPAAATAMGRVLLADLADADFNEWLEKTSVPAFNSTTVTSSAALKREIDQARRQGWAMVRGEIDENVEVIAVPIAGASGRAIAAICVSAGAGKLADSSIRAQYLECLGAAASTIARLIRASSLGLST